MPSEARICKRKPCSASQFRVHIAHAQYVSGFNLFARLRKQLRLKTEYISLQCINILWNSWWSQVIPGQHCFEPHQHAILRHTPHHALGSYTINLHYSSSSYIFIQDPMWMHTSINICIQCEYRYINGCYIYTLHMLHVVTLLSLVCCIHTLISQQYHVHTSIQCSVHVQHGPTSTSPYQHRLHTHRHLLRTAWWKVESSHQMSRNHWMKGCHRNVHTYSHGECVCKCKIMYYSNSNVMLIHIISHNCDCIFA